MTNSRSRNSTNRLWVALVVAFAVSSVAGAAHAERKRVVVLDFEGPRGERFHDDLVRLLKKTQTVVATDQWNNTAEQLDAATMLDKDVRRVAKKLKVDAIVEGKIEKRRDAFLIHLKLREGKTGEVVRAGIGTKSDGPRIDARAQRDIKDELMGAIDEVEVNRPGAAEDEGNRRVSRAEEEGDDEDAAPAKKRGKSAGERGSKAAKAGTKAGKKVASKAEADDEEDDRSARKRARDDEDEDAPAGKKGKKGAKVASSDADDGSLKKGKKAAKGATSDAEDEDAQPKKGAKGAKGASSAADDEDRIAARKKKSGAKVASAADDEDTLPPRAARKDDDRKRGAKVASSEADDEDKLPAKKSAKDARGFSKRPDDERGSDRVEAGKGDEERAALRPKTDDDAGEAGAGDGAHRAAGTRVASSDDDGTRVEVEVEPGGALGGTAARSPGQRAIELVAGASMTVRRMSFDVRPDLEQRPASYKGGRAPGAIVDATVYPLALGHRGSGILKDLGLTVMYDRVLKVSSKSQLTGMTYDTKETRLGAGLVFRHAFGSSPTAPVVLGSFGYSSQVFRIAADLDTPNVKYTMFEPGVGLRVPVTAKLIVGADARFMAITGAGQIQLPEQYGTARVLGVEGALAVDYVFASGLFARAAFRYETIDYSFKGNGRLTINRDGVGMTQDVNGARDTYFGGLATFGYLY